MPIEYLQMIKYYLEDTKKIEWKYIYSNFRDTYLKQYILFSKLFLHIHGYILNYGIAIKINTILGI